MPRMVAVVLVVLALAGGFLAGQASRSVAAMPAAATASSLTPFERGQLQVQCFMVGAQERRTLPAELSAPLTLNLTPNHPPTNLQQACLTTVEKLP